MIDTYLTLMQITTSVGENGSKDFGIVEQLFLTNGGSDGLFATVMDRCKPIAAIGIGFQIYAMIPGFSEIENIPSNITKLFWSLVLCLFIVNGGVAAKNLAVFNWAAMKAINIGTAISVDALMSLPQVRANYEGDVQALGEIEQKLKICETTPPLLSDGTSNAAFATCRTELESLINTNVSSGKIKNPNILERMAGILSSAATLDFNGLSKKVSDVIGGAISTLANPLLSTVFAGWRGAVNIAAQNALMLGILALPIPLCLSIFNISPLVIWFSSFWAVGIFQINLTILTKGFEYFNYRFGANMSVYMVDIAICFFAPSIAGIMAAGGGFGIFKAIMNVSGEIAKLAIQVPIAIAQKAILKS